MAFEKVLLATGEGRSEYIQRRLTEGATVSAIHGEINAAGLYSGPEGKSWPTSVVIAQKAKDHGFEVILHMPMEPKAKIKLELATLYTNMSDDEIRSSLSRALQTVPGADGINNHEGSKATGDRRLMKVVFGELKKDNMFFLDSLVTNYSVCESVAKETGIRFVKRSIFLDNENDPDYIKKQFEKAMNLALKSGSAVAIGHDRPNTVAVLKEMIPLIEAKGIEFTRVSNLAR